jgi:deoxyribose-phosphate aldolase
MRKIIKVVTGFIQEAIDEHFKLIMIADMVSLASQMVSDASSNLQIGYYRFSRRNCC